MRIYYFTAIAVGIMFFLYIGGVDTASNQIIGFVGGTDTSSWQTSGLWITAILAFATFAATTRISVGGLSYQASVEFVISLFVAALYIIFAGDLYSIVSIVGLSSCPIGEGLRSCSWEYWTIWALIIPSMTAYTVSLIEFIRGSD